MTREPHINAPMQVLLAMDHDTDVKFITRAIERISEMPDIHVVETGAAAMAYLHREGEFSDAQRPDLIMIDFHGSSGGDFEVLGKVKNDPELKDIPTVVLTNHEDEARTAKAFHASSTIAKPASFEQMQGVVQKVVDYWMGTGRDSDDRNN